MSFQTAREYIIAQKQGWTGYLVNHAFTFLNFAMGMPTIAPTRQEKFDEEEWHQVIHLVDEIFNKEEPQATTEFATACTDYLKKAARSKRCETFYKTVAEKLYDKPFDDIDALKVAVIVVEPLADPDKKDQEQAQEVDKAETSTLVEPLNQEENDESVEVQTVEISIKDIVNFLDTMPEKAGLSVLKEPMPDAFKLTSATMGDAYHRESEVDVIIEDNDDFDPATEGPVAVQDKLPNEGPKQHSSDQSGSETIIAAKRYDLCQINTRQEIIDYLKQIPATDFNDFLTKATIKSSIIQKEIKAILQAIPTDKQVALGEAIIDSRGRWGLSFIAIYDAFTLEDKAIFSIIQLLSHITSEERYKEIVAVDSKGQSLLSRIILDKKEWLVLEHLLELDRTKLLFAEDRTKISIFSQMLHLPEQWTILLPLISSDEERLQIIQKVAKGGISILNRAFGHPERYKRLISLFEKEDHQFIVLTAKQDECSILSELVGDGFLDILPQLKPAVRLRVMLEEEKRFLNHFVDITSAQLLKILKLLQEGERITLLKAKDYANKTLLDKLVNSNATMPDFFAELLTLLSQQECKQLCEEKQILEKIPVTFRKDLIDALYKKAEIQPPQEEIDEEDTLDTDSQTNYSFIFQCVSGFTAVSGIAGLVVAIVVLHSPPIAIACGAVAAAATLTLAGISLYRFFSGRSKPNEEDDDAKPANQLK